MTWLYAKVAPFLLPIAAVGALLLSIALGAQTLRLSWAKSDLAAERLDRANERAVREETARRAETRNAALAASHAAETVRNADAFRAQTDGLTADAAAARADGERLQRELESARAAARDQRAGADAVTCRPRGDQADTAWSLFREADRLAEEMAGAAERRAAEVRALKSQIKADRATCQGVQ